MKTGADDDSRKTPILAFSDSSARAAPAADASSTTSMARAKNFIRYPPLQSLRDRLIPSDEGALPGQRLLQPGYLNLARKSITRKRKRGRGACRLAHRKAGARNAGGRLAFMGHRGA